jgi:hypothetical protein
LRYEGRECAGLRREFFAAGRDIRRSRSGKADSQICGENLAASTVSVAATRGRFLLLNQADGKHRLALCAEPFQGNPFSLVGRTVVDEREAVMCIEHGVRENGFEDEHDLAGCAMMALEVLQDRGETP